MRQRYRDMTDAADARVDGQKFLNRDGHIFPANMAALKRVRDNAQPNTPDKDRTRSELVGMFHSRKAGA